MTYKITKIITENPFLDEIMYQIKTMSTYCIIKNQQKADEAETLEASQHYTLYKIACEDHLNFDLLPNQLPYEVLTEALGDIFSTIHINRYFVNDKHQIPGPNRPRVMESMKNYLIRTYKDYNDYYRELTGNRPLSDTTDILLSDYDVPEELTNDGEYKYLHELPEDSLFSLVQNGTIDRIIADYPDETWITYIGKGITAYNAREAENFDLLYIPTTDAMNDDIKEQFIEKYNLNKEYMLTQIYSEAYKYDSDYYDNVMAVIITIMTMTDMMATVQDHIVRRDLYDARCIQFIFEQHGVPYYNEIPIKYQINMLKNLNMLLKFKSTGKCMVDICSLFGFDSAKVYQYYLLRSRKVNSEGEFIFNYKKRKVPIKIDRTEVTTSIYPISNGDISIPISVPFDEYFSRGNKVLVYIDNTLLSSEYYYILNNVIYFYDPSILQGKESLSLKYLYNDDETEYLSAPDHHVSIANEYMDYTKEQTEYDFHPPIDDFFVYNGHMYVILGMMFITEDLYEVDIERNKIRFINEDFLKLGITDKSLRIMYLYSDAITIRHFDKSVEATIPYQTMFEIPLPREDYYTDGDDFFVTRGGTLIVKDRYHVHNNHLIFNDSNDYVDKGRSLDFHFIYNDYNNVNVTTKIEKVVATEPVQTLFNIPVPFDDYFDQGFSAFVYFNGSEIPSDRYEILNNKLQITDEAYGVYYGNYIEFLFIYGELEGISHSISRVMATKNLQMEFVIPFPYEGFLTRGNKMTVSYNGVEYVRDIDYTIHNNILEIFRIEKSLPKDSYLQFEFFYDIKNQDFIKTETKHMMTWRDGQTVYDLDFPFYHYFQSGNRFFVTVGGIFVDESQYEVIEDKLHILDNNIINLAKDRNVSVTYIYHTLYQQFDKNVHLESNTTALQEVERDGTTMKIKIPFPFDDYLELGNDFDIVIGTHTLDPGDYDVIDNTYAVIYDTDQTVDPYGDSAQFIFAYTCIGFEEEYEEDLEQDIDLKFVRVPILENPDKYLKNKNNYIEYNTVVSGDETWDGDFNHDDIKNEILNREFSYTRTKYFSVNSVSSMAKIAYQLPYFMNILLDNLKYEERLKLSLPNIVESSTHTFRFNDVLVYLFALSHIYLGVEDDIPTMPAQVLYVKGFNFQNDIAAIADDIKTKTYDSFEDYKFKEFINVNAQLLSYNQLVRAYTVNTEIYDHIVHEMMNARNKRIYRIYSQIFDALMQIKESKEYFKLPNGMPQTLTEYLLSRDNYLYGNIMKIKNIPDEQERRIEIDEAVQAATYQIQEYLDSDLFRPFYQQFAGENNDALLRYLLKVLDFFKSYKIKIYEMSTSYLFDDKLQNTIRAIDDVIALGNYNPKDSGHTIFEHIIWSITKNNKHNGLSNFKEALRKEIARRLNLDINDHIKIIDAIAGFVLSFIIEDKEGIEITENVLFDALLKVHDYMASVADTIKMSTSISANDKATLLENLYLDIERAKQLSPIDIYDISEKIMKNSNYTMEDMYKIQDVLYYITSRTMSENTTTVDSISYTTSTTQYDKVLLDDNMSVSGRYSKVSLPNMTDSYKYRDFVDSILSFYHKAETISVYEEFNTYITHYLEDNPMPEIKESIQSNLSKEDTIRFFYDLTYQSIYNRKLTIDVREVLSFLASKSTKDYIRFRDKVIDRTSRFYQEIRELTINTEQFDKEITFASLVNISDHYAPTESVEISSYNV